MSRGLRCARRGRIAILGVAVAAAGTSFAADAPSSSFALLVHSGRYPASVAEDDAAYHSVGLVSRETMSTDAAPIGEVVAVGTLIAQCHVLTSGRVTDEPMGEQYLMFHLQDPSAELGTNIQRRWAATILASGPTAAARPDWTVLRLEGCRADSGRLNVDEAEISGLLKTHEGQRRVYRLRQVGILIDGRSNAGLQVAMLGGPLQLYDADRQRWVSIGIATAFAGERSGQISAATTALAFAPGADDGQSRFFNFGSHVKPLTEILPVIEALIARDIGVRATQDQAGHPASISNFLGA